MTIFLSVIFCRSKCDFNVNCNVLQHLLCDELNMEKTSLQCFDCICELEFVKFHFDFFSVDLRHCYVIDEYITVHCCLLLGCQHVAGCIASMQRLRS